MTQTEAIYKSNQENIAYQKEENENNRQFQTDTNLLAHTWEQEARANEQAFAIAQFERENAEYNRRLQEQRAYDEQYNSPAAQVQRLKDAGINAGLASGIGTGSVGTAAGVGSASVPTVSPATPVAPRNTAPVVQPEMPPDYVSMALNTAKTINDTLQGYFDAQQKQQNLEYNYQGNPLKIAQLREMARGELFDSDLKGYNRDMAAVRYRYYDGILQGQMQGQALQNGVAEVQARVLTQTIKNLQAEETYMKLKPDLDKAHLLLDQKQAQAAIREINAHIDLMADQGKLTRAEANTELAKFLGEYAKAQGQEISNEQARALSEGLIEEYERNSRNQRALNHLSKDYPLWRYLDATLDWTGDKFGNVFGRIFK